MNRDFGKRISNSLRSKGMQQTELAERIGVTEATASGYLSSERGPKPAVFTESKGDGI